MLSDGQKVAILSLGVLVVSAWFLFMAITISYKPVQETVVAQQVQMKENFSLHYISDYVSCETDKDCDGQINGDACFYGLVCHNNQCVALIYDTCCESDGINIICPSLMVCSVDEDCDDNNVCTDDDCKPYLFGGVCLHKPVYIGVWECGIGGCESTIPKCQDGLPVAPSECVPLEPSEEICDGMDNDCDGETDEVCPNK